MSNKKKTKEKEPEQKEDAVPFREVLKKVVKAGKMPKKKK